ncbi:3'-5' exonuclease domain-containing protein 2 [Litoribacter ruber]|uniref:3'-5' exonuclease domain-containing protein 2 n=1 Tax=Litoribacter ruber TaxID=702568 RepID=A0AAP2CEG8_9BACT|nr:MULTISPECIES: 3'-5' exonuclease [Litoribacter]MBS9522943.1 3'-5' exonuclease domain-containing protein 2 [Litoribacter alkaliphilus]MBT0810893.1 3'-5' exonuclease domain-containing protein 2 [Litoribacter ruber]
MIPLRISKTEVNELPLGQFEGDIVLVDEPKGLPELIRELGQENRLGFDTETRPAFRKGVMYDVALLQLSTPDKAYLVRLNQVGFSDPLKELLEEPSIVKIGAAVRDDLKALKKLNKSFQPESFFDLNEELKKIGFHNVGVRNLSAMVLNIRISKSEQVSNWEADLLTEKQKRYAATDAWACLEIFHELERKGYLEELFKRGF